MPTVTVITLSRDNPAELSRTLSSLRRQRPYLPSSIVIDGSGELLAPRMKHICAHYGAQYFWAPPNGVYSAMNVGLMKAQSEYVFFLNSGDWLVSKHSMSTIQTQVDLSSGAPWLVGQVVLERDGKASLSRQTRADSRLGVRLGLTWFPHPATIYDRQRISSLGGFDPTFTIAADYLLALRMLRAFGPPAMIASALAVHHLDGLSALNPARGAWEGVRARAEVFGLAQFAIEIVTFPALILLRKLRKSLSKSSSAALPVEQSSEFSIEHYCQGPQSQWPRCCAEFLSAPGS